MEVELPEEARRLVKAAKAVCDHWCDICGSDYCPVLRKLAVAIGEAEGKKRAYRPKYRR